MHCSFYYEKYQFIEFFILVSGEKKIVMCKKNCYLIKRNVCEFYVHVFYIRLYFCLF